MFLSLENVCLYLKADNKGRGDLTIKGCKVLLCSSNIYDTVTAQTRFLVLICWVTTDKEL